MPSPATGNDAGLADPLLPRGDGTGRAGASSKNKYRYWVPAADDEEVLAAEERGGEDGRPLLYRTFKVRGILLHPYRLINLARLIVIIQFFIWRMRHRDSDSIALWWITVVGDFWFGVSWLLNQASKVNPIRRVPKLALLNQQFDPPGGGGGGSSSSQLPGVDVFINTVDPVDEPVLCTMNSVLSILATDYPVDRHATYFSDDGGSLVHYEALLETARFAALWAPFCRKHRVEPRAPESYFAATADGPYAGDAPGQFVDDRRHVRREYEEFRERLAALFTIIPQRSEAYERESTKRDGARATYMADGSHWPGTWMEPAENHKKGQHAAIVQVMLNHPSDEPQLGEPASSDSPLDLSAVDVRLPMLVYIAREKRPGYDHQKKAGAMNVQLRVSALLSNAPFIINFDGDHYINNSAAFRAAMCFMLDGRHGEDTAFVQFPQRFDDVDPTDRYCNHNRVFFDATALGLNGLQGPSYVGTGCMFRRAALYGADPPRWQPDDFSKLLDNPWRQFGNSMPFINSVPLATHQERPVAPPASLDGRLTAELTDVSTCAYEDGTEWGYGVGWVYNIATEDVVTGFRIHRKGWRSMYCSMEPDAFRGTAPINLTERLYQILRWSGGSLDMFFSRNCPLLAGRRLHPMQRVAYTNMTVYPISAAFIFVYDLLPLMWLSGAEFYIQKPFPTYVVYLFAGIAMMEVSGMVEIRWAGLTLLDWCRNEQFYMIGATGVYPAAVLHSLLRLVGLKGLPFKLTSKPQSASGGEAKERFAELYEVQWAPLLVPTVVVIAVNVAAIGAAAGRVAAGGWSLAQIAGAAGGLLFNAWVLLLLYPFALGIMGRWSKRPYLLFVLLVTALAAIASAYVALLAVLAPGFVPPFRLGRWSGVGAIISPASWRF
ncbi:hypothetical protein GQ55_2G393300 [Panicum hallii var. hallii]|uniref:Glycosyltransferase 2-like domain-containing protein n=1 Tax=Panicum hallii var. hallii TaxID=1504633 RepID=A0A2T7EX70_9POAL|nr:hypothetical protein GQ55_2G393300 [Panicum hallii var. hallii]